jgi:hypothetical protein
MFNPTLLMISSEKGFCDKDSKVISHATFSKSSLQDIFKPLFATVITWCYGVRQLLQHEASEAELISTIAFGGPIEDALTMELLIVLLEFHSKTDSFNPKLSMPAMAAETDLYLNLHRCSLSSVSLPPRTTTPKLLSLSISSDLF